MIETLDRGAVVKPINHPPFDAVMLADEHDELRAVLRELSEKEITRRLHSTSPTAAVPLSSKKRHGYEHRRR